MKSEKNILLTTSPFVPILNFSTNAKKKNIAISLVEQERFLLDKGNPAQACSTLSSIGVVFMVLKTPPEKVHVSHRCMYVPLISEITLDNFLFGYLKDQGVN